MPEDEEDESQPIARRSGPTGPGAFRRPGTPGAGFGPARAPAAPGAGESKAPARGGLEGPDEDAEAAREPRADTQREVVYLRRLIDQNVPVTVKLRDGEVFHGVIEYYDRRFIRLTREGAPNLFLFKKDILYLFEDPPQKTSS